MAELVVSTLLNAVYSFPTEKVLGKGVEEGFEKFSTSLASVQTVLFDADQKQFLDESVRGWADKVEDFCYEADGLLDLWRTDILKSQIEKKEGKFGLSSKKVRFFCARYSCFYVLQFCGWSLHHHIARKIIQMNKKLDEIAYEKEKYAFDRRIIEEERRMTTFSTPLVDESVIYGRTEEKDTLLGKLLLSERSKDKKGHDIIPIVGMCGLGKTTLVQLAYNDDRVKSRFEKRIWVHVGDPFDLICTSKAIIQAITGSIPELFELESLLSYIHESIQGKRFLLVLDDLWIEDLTKWESLAGSLKHGAVGSKVVVTTRKEIVAAMMGATTCMIILQSLSDEFCWAIFSRLAFSERNREEREQLECVGKEIVKKCKGLPLVAKTLGSLVRFKSRKQEWLDVLHHQLWELSDVSNTVFSPLLLSYYDLPSSEKHCLLYCSLFPIDHKIDKDDLIELWMSQGYLDANKTLDIGEKCFESLAMRSFFQDFESKFHGEITTCKMHDVIRDFVQFVTRNSCFIWELFGGNEKTNPEKEITRHLTLLLRYGAQVPISVHSKTKLRTLFVIRSEKSTPLNLNFLPKLLSLRTLCLSRGGIEELPCGIHKLLHLQYLNLSDNSKLQELPSELCNLINLRTLRLNGCIELRSLPNQIGKLMNLSHLYIAGCSRLKGLPKGIGRLHFLRILDVFIVPCDYLRNKKAMKLGDLSNLEHLQRYLCIRGIENVEYAGDAKKAELWNKDKLIHLELDFWQGNGPRRTEDEVEVLLEALQPPSHLICLEIRGYRGVKLPNWIGSLDSLKRLQLTGCSNCEILPSIGKLPSLEILHIVEMGKLEKIGLEFLGVETGSNTTEIKSPSVSFPKLKELRFWDLPSWKQWLGIGYSMSSLKIMPSLHILEISDCESLETLPDFMQAMPVEDLVITNCPILEKRCQKEVGEDWFNISHIKNIQIVGASQVELWRPLRDFRRFQYNYSYWKRIE